MNHQFLIVWGMHRSGTSLLSRALQVFGASHADRQLVIHSGNPTGYWEDRDLVSLDDEMLNTIGVNWDSLDVVTDAHVELLVHRGYLDRARDFLFSTDISLRALKDPRMSKLGPFWLRVFATEGITPLCVVANRNPLSVVCSLQRRKGIRQSPAISQRSYCYELWGHYTTQALATTAQFPRVCVEYDLFLQHPEDMLRRIGARLQLSVDEAALKSFVGEFLNIAHRHNIYRLADVLADPECPPRVAALYRDLYAGAGELECVAV